MVRIIGAFLIIFPGNIIGGAILYAVTALVMTDPTQGDHSDDGDSVIKGEFREK
ncbi:PspC domain-containing protein [Lactiplantibacillus plantarum]|uniref:PspC domain-containing protein n=1 Tax=Lactiplantibacillus plantarum TaxID=1590 RepID=UPI0035D069A6|nr:PspC domain-containing protein [Lactiplantibacillus plantarum]